MGRFRGVEKLGNPRCLSPSELLELALLRRKREAYLWGELPPGPRVAIVGSRGASEAGLLAARSLAYELARRGITVASGGAKGIDKAAHEGALDGGGKTLVVAPLWLERGYPTEHRELFERICEAGGGYLTVSSREAPPVQATFFLRNELLAALSTIVIVGESRFRSGARNAVSHAVRMRRPIFVLPSVYGCRGGLGSNALLGRVARAVLSASQIERSLFEPTWPGVEESLALVDREAGLIEPPSKTKLGSTRKASENVAPKPFLPVFGDDAAGSVLRAIFEGATTIDEVVRRTGLAASAVTYEIVLHTLSGAVRENEAGLLIVSR